MSVRTNDVVELRSDTFTLPTPAMRKAMAEAEVGDDCWGEDPTAIALQEHCAALFGKEAGLFVPTGTMGNEASMKALTNPGEEVIVDSKAHIVLYEKGAPGAISGALLRTIETPDGQLDPEGVASMIRAPNRVTAHTGLVWIENTHNQRGGRIVPLDNIRALSKVARERGVKVFMDGARIFNAAVATGIPVRDWAAEVDGLTFCFSKGLGAPVGSMVIGSRDFVDRVHHVRRMLGGGMRQVGVLCAAARVAVEQMVDRLAEDHANAKRLAGGFAGALAGSVDAKTVETNMVFAELGSLAATEVTASMLALGVRVAPTGVHTIRAVTHKDVDAAGIDRAIEAFGQATRA
jgi:threonine aldolase